MAEVDYKQTLLEIRRHYDRFPLHETDQYKAVHAMLEVVMKQLERIEKKISMFEKD